MIPPSKPDSASADQISDRDLVMALQSGQTEALMVIYRRYSSLVYGLALKMMSNRQEAEDLTQEVFVNLWQKQQYDPDRGSLGSYLATYTRSRAIDRQRVSSNRFRILRQFQRVIQPSPKLPTPLEAASQQERHHQLRDALNQLPETERQVLEIAYFDGLSQSQIAQRLDIPLGTVKSRSRKGLLRLRSLLNTDDFA
ncbi:RNA polymerase subunit sigma [filamentous cyanobacterium CCP5]|nr:RNA polymerase subunit sigma [filamentous cyanobacterium CCP5]